MVRVGISGVQAEMYKVQVRMFGVLVGIRGVLGRIRKVLVGIRRVLVGIRKVLVGIRKVQGAFCECIALDVVFGWYISILFKEMLVFLNIM